MIDTHVHFWRYSPQAHSWIGKHMRPLQRDFLPADLESEMRANGVEGCIAVQALHSEDETRWLLELADEHAWIVGVIGWVDLCAPGLVAELDRLAAHDKLVGIRHLAHDEPDARFLMRDDVVRGIAQLAEFDLAFDLLVREREMPAAIELARCLPNQTFVLDHLGKPPMRTGNLDGWSKLVRELGRCENVVAKVSGLVTESHGRPFDDVGPCVETAFESFGADRLMAGSDWPVCLLAGDYPTAIDFARERPHAGSEMRGERRLAEWGARARQLVYGV